MDDDLPNPAEFAYRLFTDLYGSENVDHESFLKLMAVYDSTDPLPEFNCDACGSDLMKSGWVPIERNGKYFCSPECDPGEPYIR